MTSISHALIGASIAAKVSNPVGAVLLSLVTHFVCDVIPHWDLGTNWRLRPKIVTGTLAILETIVAFFGTYIIFYRFISPALLAITIFASLIPDWLEVPYYLTLPRSPKIFYWIYKVQSVIHSRQDVPWGVVSQTVVVALFLWVGFLL